MQLSQTDPHLRMVVRPKSLSPTEPRQTTTENFNKAVYFAGLTYKIWLIEFLHVNDHVTNYYAYS